MLEVKRTFFLVKSFFSLDEAQLHAYVSENEKLREDLQKVEQLEDKINTELVMLRDKIDTMEKELVTFRDIDALKHQSEEKKQVSLSR